MKIKSNNLLKPIKLAENVAPSKCLIKKPANKRSIIAPASLSRLSKIYQPSSINVNSKDKNKDPENSKKPIKESINKVK